MLPTLKLNVPADTPPALEEHSPKKPRTTAIKTLPEKQPKPKARPSPTSTEKTVGNKQPVKASTKDETPQVSPHV